MFLDNNIKHYDAPECHEKRVEGNEAKLSFLSAFQMFYIL